MAVITGMSKETGALLKHIGIDPKTTRSVTIHMPCDDVVTVNLERYLLKDDINTGELETQKFNLVPIEE